MSFLPLLSVSMQLMLIHNDIVGSKKYFHVFVFLVFSRCIKMLKPCFLRLIKHESKKTWKYIFIPSCVFTWFSCTLMIAVQKYENILLYDVTWFSCNLIIAVQMYESMKTWKYTFIPSCVSPHFHAPWWLQYKCIKIYFYIMSPDFHVPWWLQYKCMKV